MAYTPHRPTRQSALGAPRRQPCDKITGTADPADAIFELVGLTILAPGWGTPLPADAQNLKP